MISIFHTSFLIFMLNLNMNACLLGNTTHTKSLKSRIKNYIKKRLLSKNAMSRPTHMFVRVHIHISSLSLSHVIKAIYCIINIQLQQMATCFHWKKEYINWNLSFWELTKRSRRLLITVYLFRKCVNPRWRITSTHWNTAWRKT